MYYFSCKHILSINNSFIDIINGIIAFLVPENVCLDTKIAILSGIEAEIMALIGFYMVAILESKIAAILDLEDVGPTKNLNLRQWIAHGKSLVLLSGVSPKFS